MVKSIAYIVVLAPLIIGGCAPTVKIETPEKPVEINLNLKIDHEVRVKLDREIDDMIKSNPDLF